MESELYYAELRLNGSDANSNSEKRCLYTRLERVTCSIELTESPSVSQIWDIG